MLENIIISHNREALVNALGSEKTYKMIYGSISTAAIGSIIYGFARYGRGQGPQVAWKIGGHSRFKMLALPLQAFGLMLASQAVPELTLSRYINEGGCPFEFKKKGDEEIKGVERITRHPSLWALGLFGLGYASSATYVTQFAFGALPVLFTIIGGAHQDHRHRESGQLSGDHDTLTSHVPFGALIGGRQSWEELSKEIKMENIAIALSIASLLALRRVHLAKKLISK